MFKRLKILRKKYKLTQNNIAEILKISQSTYSLYETGKKEIPVTILSELAKYYKTSIDFLIGDTDRLEKY